MFMFGMVVGVALGGAAVWMGKEQIQMFWKTGSEIAAALEAKAAALRGKL